MQLDGIYMNDKPEILTELSLDYESMVSYVSKVFKQNDEDREIGMIYESQVPKVSYDVEAIVTGMRKKVTGE